MKQKTKIKIGLIYGGPSSEHEVSVRSAEQVKKYLDKNKYLILPIKISKQGRWPKNLHPYNLKNKIDIAFIVMHGEYGEDGTIQALLESENIPYTGSRVLASSLAMDKFRSDLIAKSVGLRTPYTNLGSAVDVSKFFDSAIIKPNTGGSSVGVKLISKSQLKRLVSTHKINANEVVQEYISGVECTVSVIEINGQAKPLPVIEIVPKSKFYDFKSKYAVGGSEHIIPGRFSKSVIAKLQAQAKLIHETLGCRGMSRSDFLINRQNQIFYLETNTIPGMTKTSLLPQAAQNIGIQFPELLDLIVKASL